MQGLRVLRTRFRWKLYATYCAIVAVTALAIGLLVNHQLARSLERDLESTLRDFCRLVTPFAERCFGAEDEEAIQRELASLGSDGRIRVTLIGPEGRVLVDSAAAPRRMDDHRRRPEIVQALANEVGTSQRTSTTVGYEMLYVARALRDESGEHVGTVRVALPLREIEQQLAGIRRTVLLGTLVGLVLALLVAFFVAHRITTPISQMTRVAESMRAGRYDARVRLERGDEIGVLADTLNRLGEQMTRRIDTISQDDAQLRAMLAGMVEGVIAVDSDDTIAFCNDAARDLLRIPSADVVGRNLWDVAPVAELEELLATVRRRGSTASREIEMHRRGRERVLNAHVSPFAGGGNEGMVVVLHDISELRRLERVRRDFVANVSHELKTPLTSIKGFVETLLAGALYDEENNERFLRRIDVNVERLHHLVSDLLSLARIESHHGRVPTVAVDWRDVIDDVLKRHEDAFEEERVECVVEPATGGLVVEGDPEAMTQVLDNLVDNAIKYGAAGGRVAIRLSEADGRGRLVVEDEGAGIPPEDLDRIFERFYRVDKARSREVGGTGLGLSIVRHLVLSMGGDVRVDSRLAEGTRFTVDLGLARRR